MDRPPTCPLAILSTAAILLTAVSCTTIAPRNSSLATTAASASIGAASQEADGTIVLTLRAEFENGGLGDGQLRYPRDHAQHAMIAKHVGPIPPGGSVFVRPFPPR